ncbi:MAG: CapA family protein [Clostridia bacterium]|nr:CapA family protein [Clostridia bacterium]
MQKRHFLLALAAVLILAVCGAAADSLSVRASGSVAAYGDNTLQISAPAAGELSVVIGDPYNEYRHMTLRVEAGSQTVHWDGLADDGQRIGRFNGKYTLKAVLTSEGGETWEASAQIEVARSSQALLFALPSSPVLEIGGESWFVELQAMRKGKEERIVMKAAAADAPGTAVCTQEIKVGTTDTFRFTWDGRNGKNPLPAGEYILTFYAKGAEDRTSSFALTIRDSAERKAEIAPTGSIMPTLWMSDAEIWQLMQKPSVVVDQKATGKQKIYKEASRSSKAAGTVYGQTQALEVISVSGGWAKVSAWSQEDGEEVTGYIQTDKLKVVTPGSTYGLLIDKNAQTMIVFENGQRIAEIPVSTGLVAKNKLSRETAAGMYLTADRVNEYSSGKQTSAYGIRFAGPNMIQSVAYRKTGTHADYTDQSALLGQKNGVGSILVPHLPGEDAAPDAWWLYSHLPQGTRVVILDDPYVRRVQASTVQAGGVIQPYREQQAGRSEIPDFGDARIVTVTFGGDAVIGTREAWMKREDAFPAFIEKYGMAYPFSGLQSVFAHDDMTMINLECVLKANKAGEDKEKWYRFRGMPSWAQVLTDGSIEQVNIANNHHIDYGSAGKKETRAALEAINMPYSGYGYTYIFEQDSHKIGFAGIRETTFFQGKNRVAEEIKSLRDAGCEVVVYTGHWGVEYSAAHNEIQMEVAKAAVAAGADLVMGGHPHVVQGISVLEDVPVVWSLGNLMFGGTIELTEYDALLVQAQFVFGVEGYEGCTLELIPIIVSGRFRENINDYRPVLAENADKYRILQKIQADSDFAISEKMWFPAR